MNKEKQSGFMYLVRNPSGDLVGMGWADPGFEEDTARNIYMYIEKGFTIEKVDWDDDEDMQ